MYRIAYVLKRKTDTSLDEFRVNLEGTHVPLIHKSLGQRATHYTRKYLLPRAGRDSAPAQHSPFDVFVELVFKSRRDYEEAIEHLGPAEIELIKATTGRFADPLKSKSFVVEEHISPIGDVRRDHLLHWKPGMLAEDKSSAQQQPIRYGSFFKRKPGMSHADFKRYYEAKHVLIGYKYITYNATLYSRKFLRPLAMDPLFSSADGELTDTPYDVFMELTFPTAGDRERVFSALTSADWEIINADEAQFMDRSDRLGYELDERLSRL